MRNEKARNNVVSSCRRVMSIVAGADSKTLADVVEMRMRSVGASDAVQQNVLGTLLDERSMASEDYSY